MYTTSIPATTYELTTSILPTIWLQKNLQQLLVIIIIIIINPSTARVVGAPQMISQPVFSIFLVLRCPMGRAELQACPFPDVVFNNNRQGDDDSKMSRSDGL